MSYDNNLDSRALTRAMINFWQHYKEVFDIEPPSAQVAFMLEKLAEWNATYDKVSANYYFDSEEDKTIFILRWVEEE